MSGTTEGRTTDVVRGLTRETEVELGRSTKKGTVGIVGKILCLLGNRRSHRGVHGKRIVLRGSDGIYRGTTTEVGV